MKKKICMVVPSFSAKGGITTVVSGYRGSELESVNSVKYVETYCDGNIIKKIAVFLKGYLKYIFLLIFWRPSIVHIHSAFGGSFIRKKYFINIAFFLRIKIINHIHGSYYDEFYFNAEISKKRVITKTFNRCDIIVALSEAAKRQIELITNTKVEVVENYGILYEDEIKKRDHRKNNLIVLFLGFVTEKKGCFDIPRIMESVIEHISDVRFIIAGDGDIGTVMEKLTDKSRDHIIFPGWVNGSEKRELLSCADVFFLPSYSEGMPMSILEAMGYGLPIVASNVGGIPKIVIDGKNGYTFAPGSIEDFANAIVKLLINNDMRDKMGKESVMILKNNYSQTKHCQKIQEIYEYL